MSNEWAFLWHHFLTNVWCLICFESSLLDFPGIKLCHLGIIIFSPSFRVLYLYVLLLSTRIDCYTQKNGGSYKIIALIAFSLVQSLSHVRLFVTPWTAECQASLSIANSQSLLKLLSIKLVMPSNHLILCCPLLLLPSPFPRIKVFSSESVLRIRWPKYWSFSFSIPSNEYSGLISFRIGWFELLAVQGTLKNLLQHHIKNISSSVLSLLYGPTLSSIYDYWKNHTFD